MNDTVQDLMREATRLTQAGRLAEATAAIQRALNGDSGFAAPTQERTAPLSPRSGATVAMGATTHSKVLDGIVLKKSVDPDPAAGSPADPGEFTSGTHTDAGLTRRYKLYAPPGHAGKALPLVVMLHGCTQDPDDFAIGTGLNEAAREQGFFVLYPAQAKDANPQRCWNWFKHTHQERGRGEPALIASLTLSVMQAHGIDARRVYVAGLSAGGAMAAIVAAAYPDIFAAACVHSGLAAGSARNVSEALAVMGSGASVANGSGSRGSPSHQGTPVPTVVFHGDQDHTVHPRNGEQVVAAAIHGSATAAAMKVEHGVSTKGQRFTRTIHHDAAGDSIAEHWLLHGAGHAWSGGNAGGSYTDDRGPDATREMLRFFLAHPQRVGQ